MDWSNQLADITKPPETVDEAVNRLMAVIDSQHKLFITTMTEDDLIDLHFTLGVTIRNAFGLHDLGSKLLADCGVVHPDDAAGVIINALWNKL